MPDTAVAKENNTMLQATPMKAQYSTVPKLEPAYLESVATAQKTEAYFGNWIANLDQLSKEFKLAEPYPHLVLDNFFSPQQAEVLHDNFPLPDDQWFTYCNPIEVKRTLDNLNLMPKVIRDFFYTMSTPKTVDMMKKITGVQTLEADPFLHGAGLHAHGPNGRLNLHLDYERHPITSKQRRLNVIVYMNKNWKEEWNGQIQLWNQDMSECKASVNPVYNRAVIFQTNDISWHGLPDRIKCPEGEFRKSFAYYYVSDFESDKPVENSRLKATFIKRPQDPADPRMEELYKLRPVRRIEPEDMQRIWPEWTPKLDY